MAVIVFHYQHLVSFLLVLVILHYFYLSFIAIIKLLGFGSRSSSSGSSRRRSMKPPWRGLAGIWFEGLLQDVGFRVEDFWFRVQGLGMGGGRS